MKKLKEFDFKKVVYTMGAAMLIFSFLTFTSCDDDDDDIIDDEEIVDEDDSDSTSTLVINNYVLAASGQTIAYDIDGEVVENLTETDSLWGQDAHYLKGETMSYELNSDATTTTDLVTGLMWETVPSSDDYTWDEAVEYCENLELDGYTDWRMPSLKELFSISDFETGWPYIDTDFFDLASGEVSKDEQFWSSNYYVGVTVEGGSEAAFGVNHVTGHIKAYAANSGGPVGGKYVRAVRGDEYGTNEYVENGDSTITDNNTGLMWAQYDDEGIAIEWLDALVYAKESELAGHSDWRLPNVKELQSIVDYSYSITATDESLQLATIDPLFDCTMIISEAGYDDYGYYWTSTSAPFTSGEPYYYAWYVAFGRAVNDVGEDFHGAGAVRFDTKDEDGPAGEDAERYFNLVRLVRDVD